MARQRSEELYVTVPSYFRCPISMDVMKSPVSLITGVTYDRSSIQKWLAEGHNTCPATMQVLNSTDVVPNLTLRRLIRQWSSDSLLLNPQLSDGSSSISKQRIIDCIKRIIEKKIDDYADCISKIVDYAKFSEENRKFLSNVDEFVPTIVGILSNVDDVRVSELIVSVLNLVLHETGVKEELRRLLFRNNRECLSPLVLLLQSGSLISKIESAKLVESIAFDSEAQRTIAEKQGLLNELYQLVSCSADRAAVEAGLSALIAVSTSRPVKKEIVRLGIVRTAGKILSEAESRISTAEKALKILEMVCTCTEGRTAICEDKKCVTATVQRLMKVPSAATEHGVTVLWSVCHLARERAAQEAVIGCNGVAKLLLVMQSSCSATARQMCVDLVKACRVNSKSCLASYDTKTIHITPY